jgi:hypothetical protein
MIKPMEMPDMVQSKQIRQAFLAKARQYLFAAATTGDPGGGQNKPVAHSIEATTRRGKSDE